MIAMMLHLPTEKDKLFSEHNNHSVLVHTVEYKIDNISVYNILHQIFKDTDLYPYVKQHKYKRDGREAFYAIHSMWSDLNHVNATASEAKLASQKSTYNR